MSDTVDFENDAEQPEDSPDALRELHVLVQDLATAEVVAAKATDALKAAQEVVRLLQEKKIPDLMNEVGLDTLGLNNGQMLTVKPVVGVKWPKGVNAERGVTFMDSIGESGSVKRTIEVRFDKDQREQADEIIGLVESHEVPLDFAVAEKVEPATLKRIIKEQIEKGAFDDAAKELFQFFTKQVAKVK